MSAAVIRTRSGPLARLLNAFEAWLLRHDIDWLDRVIEAYERNGAGAGTLRALRDQRAEAVCRLASLH